MISRRDLQARAAEWGLREDVVEKDYVLGWVLWGIGSEPAVRDLWVFKGGTCLKKCYLETFRFSEDLDFTILPEGPTEEDAIQEILNGIVERIGTESGIDFTVRPIRLRRRPNDSLEARVYYQGPRGAPVPASIRLDLTVGEELARPPVVQPIRHLYPDALPEPGTVRCYSLEEVFAEKLRALGERGRPRDLYDVVFLFRQPDLNQNPQVVHETLLRKCETKGVPVPTLEGVEASPYRDELASEWENMLAHQLPALAPLDHYWEQLTELFAWLTGGEPIPEQAVVSASADEAVWEPTPSSWTWGAGPPLEPLRFAGANRLCVDLGYRGTVRRVEPYSLRVTRDGNLLLYATRVDNRQLRSYRVDRIESIEVTTQPFRPSFRVEFTNAGVRAKPQARPFRAGPPKRTLASRRPYRVECSLCGKCFSRKRPSTRVNPHKNPAGYRCPGRSGFLV